MPTHDDAEVFNKNPESKLSSDIEVMMKQFISIISTSSLDSNSTKVSFSLSFLILPIILHSSFVLPGINGLKQSGIVAFLSK